MLWHLPHPHVWNWKLVHVTQLVREKMNNSQQCSQTSRAPETALVIPAEAPPPSCTRRCTSSHLCAQSHCAISGHCSEKLRSVRWLQCCLEFGLSGVKWNGKSRAINKVAASLLPWWRPYRWRSGRSGWSPAGPNTSPTPPSFPWPASGTPHLSTSSRHTETRSQNTRCTWSPSPAQPLPGNIQPQVQHGGPAVSAGEGGKLKPAPGCSAPSS